jgi:RNA polymerase sigma-70 factor
MRDGATLRSTHANLVDRLFTASEAARWDVTIETFSHALQASVSHRLGADADWTAVARYLEGLRAADLALACACRDGHEGAWEHFVRDLRPALYAAARAVAGEAGRELADLLYADLFGLRLAGGERRSLFAHYHGRSRLVTWLRSVIAQRHVDRLRAGARLEPLEEEDTSRARARYSTTASPDDPHRVEYVALTQRSLDAAIDALDSTDRLRLRLYYGESLTLAQIGTLLGEHEATVSRKLDRLRRDLRRRVEQLLRDEHGLADAAVRLCVEYAASAPELQLDRLLARADDG